MSELALIKEQTLTNIGDAIREKTNTTDKIYPKDMPEKIRSIQTGINLKDLLTKRYKIVVDQANIHNQYIEYNIGIPHGTDTMKYQSTNDATKTYDTNSLIYLFGEIKPMEGYKPGKLKVHSDIGLFDDMVINKDTFLSVPFISDVYITEVTPGTKATGIDFENYMSDWYWNDYYDLTELTETTKNIITNPAIKAINKIKDLDPTMRNMFQSCGQLTTIPKIVVDTSDVTSLERMFAGCNRLEKIDLSGLNTSKIKSINGMFDNCRTLKSIDMSMINTSLLETYDRIVNYCSNLEVLDLSGTFIIKSDLIDYGTIISDCPKLKYIIFNNENTELLTNSKFVNWFSRFGNTDTLTILIPGDQAKLDSIKSQINQTQYTQYHIDIDLISNYTITKPGDGTVEVKKKINKKGTMTFVTHVNPATITIDVDQNGSLVEPLAPKINDIKPGYFVEYWGNKPVNDGSGLTIIRTTEFDTPGFLSFVTSDLTWYAFWKKNEIVSEWKETKQDDDFKYYHIPKDNTGLTNKIIKFRVSGSGKWGTLPVTFTDLELPVCVKYINEGIGIDIITTNLKMRDFADDCSAETQTAAPRLFGELKKTKYDNANGFIFISESESNTIDYAVYNITNTTDMILSRVKCRSGNESWPISALAAQVQLQTELTITKVEYKVIEASDIKPTDYKLNFD